LAYGYSNDIASGRWLVFDLGGGTFDLALVGVEGGQIVVLDHEGENFLGGKDFDWLVVEAILVPRLAVGDDVQNYRSGSDSRRKELAVLKPLAEEAKIALSAATETTVTIESGSVALIDDRRREISLDIRVTRAELEDAIRDRLARTVDLSKRLLSRA